MNTYRVYINETYYGKILKEGAPMDFLNNLNLLDCLNELNGHSTYEFIVEEKATVNLTKKFIELIKNERRYYGFDEEARFEEPSLKDNNKISLYWDSHGILSSYGGLEY